MEDQLAASQFAYISGPGKGTTCALTLMYHRIVNHLDSSSGAVRILTIDYAKAFDKLPHATIMDSVTKLRLPKQSVHWIHSFLTGRRQSVRIGSDVSSWTDITSGVPQGSVLGPLLFCAVFDSLSVIYSNSDIIKYADDVTILNYVRAPSDDHLQEEWNNIINWSTRVGLSINMSKCSVMDVVTKRNLSLKKLPSVPHVNFVKILGLTLLPDLTWNMHISTPW